ncbi:hypothetical protein [Sphingomonas sp. Leaf25]|uniref:hypothetical protein n=1 Tax=Sphingomonas sp. Leaf25 TaxID=1735692 RepID=UPI0006FDBD44|nr:hypothetical protein [Sphingomonas sp. Leaf25]KQN00012.1 hypothetical protein ASE78_17750 [Sphingomonas sp. Leaf25]
MHSLAPTARPVPGTISPWPFRASRRAPRALAGRVRGMLRSLRGAPASLEIKPVTQRPRWSLYFVWAPDGRIEDCHRFTLARLRERDAGVLVVVATPTPADIPRELYDAADALWWKALSGYDFSAYAIGLHAIAAASPAADVFVMNDSVFGPLLPLEPLLDTPWDLTAMTASSLFENHVQSYAFHLRGVTPARMRALASVFSRRWSVGQFQDVVFLQETRFARVAARTMSVGAWWWAAQGTGSDLMVRETGALVDAGMPFVKRSLFGKKREEADAPAVAAALALLARHHHPIAGLDPAA